MFSVAIIWPIFPPNCRNSRHKGDRIGLNHCISHGIKEEQGMVPATSAQLITPEFEQGSLYYQPKQCIVIFGKSLNHYHRFVLVDSPKNGSHLMTFPFNSLRFRASQWLHKWSSHFAQDFAHLCCGSRFPTPLENCLLNMPKVSGLQHGLFWPGLSPTRDICELMIKHPQWEMLMNSKMTGFYPVPSSLRV